MRVLVVSAWDGASGVLTVIRSLAEQLRGHGVVYSAFSFDGWGVDSQWRSCCERLYSNQEISLTELLVRDHFDIVHLIDTACAPPFNPNVWLRRARYQGGVVCMSQNTIQEVPPDQFAHVFVACSEASREVMARTVSAPIRVIPNGADTTKFYPRPVERPLRPILAWVGRTADLKQKDIFGFLHLAASLADANYDFWIADAGLAPEFLRLQDWFGERIRYVSQLDQQQLAVFYSEVAASEGAIVSTSTYEGLPLALLEAAACGCPVIAPRVPGMEYILHEQTGLLYDRQDALPTIKALLAKLQDDCLRDKLISNSKNIIQERYNSFAMATSYFEAYQEAISQAKKSETNTSRISFEKRCWSSALGVRRMLRRVHPRKSLG